MVPVNYGGDQADGSEEYGTRLEKDLSTQILQKADIFDCIWVYL